MWAIVVWHKMKPFPTDLKFRGRILSDLLTSKNSIDFLFHSIMASTEGTDSHRFPHNLIKETLANHFFISILLLGDIGVLTPQQSFNHKPQQLYMSIQLKRQWLGISLSIETSRDRSPVVLVRGLGYCVWVDEWVFTRDIERKKSKVTLDLPELLRFHLIVNIRRLKETAHNLLAAWTRDLTQSVLLHPLQFSWNLCSLSPWIN